jgi:hypothetical protein
MSTVLKRRVLFASLALAAAGCIQGVPGEGESDGVETFDESMSALNGAPNPSGSLTRLTFQEPNEANRQADTVAYYQQVHIGANGTSGGTISSALPTLTSFINNYGFAGSEVVTYYYNRGDLGIGREMHCVDKVNVANNGQIACYVKNFAAGDDNSEFTFGLSSNIAFANLHASHAFATVVMVFRSLAPQKDKVFFAVYNAAGNLANAAALDRVGVSFAQNQDPKFGTPGVNFNNHIPSNCISCHGGAAYDKTGHSETGSLFLPFDLDQFEYENVGGRTRTDQLTAFKHQNEMVRKVASVSGNGTAIKNQLDTWYANTSFQTDKTEVFENNFNPAAVPSGWSNGSVFFNVVRASCRTCHVSNPGQANLTFDTESQFDSLAGLAANDLCSMAMPHSLQSLREFWQSNRPATLEAYYRGVGQTTAADTLHNCALSNSNHNGVVTLDPPHIQASLAAVF